MDKVVVEQIDEVVKGEVGVATTFLNNQISDGVVDAKDLSLKLPHSAQSFTPGGGFQVLLCLVWIHHFCLLFHFGGP
jgi:hypothetical protein